MENTNSYKKLLLTAALAVGSVGCVQAMEYKGEEGEPIPGAPRRVLRNEAVMPPLPPVENTPIVITTPQLTEAELRAQIMEGIKEIDRNYLVQVIDNIPEADHVGVLTHVQSLITAGMDGYQRERVIKAVAAVGQDLPIGERAAERVNVLTHVQSLITEGMDGYNRVQVIEALAAVGAGLSAAERAAERAVFVAQAQ